MDERVRAFLEQHHSAAMTALRADGTPHVARIGIVLVEGRLWSSSTRTRFRTRLLRRDPRSTLFVFPNSGSQYLGLETTVTIIEGPEVPDLSVQLFRAMQPNAEAGTLAWGGRTLSYDAFRQAMRDDQRIIYEFDVQRAYGLY